MRSRILIGLIAGTIGGFLGWFLQESLINYNAHVSAGVLPGQGAVVTALSAEENRTLIYCVGGLIGLFLGLVEGIIEGSTRKLMRGMVIGAISGVILGYIGIQYGSYVYEKLGGANGAADPGIGSFAKQVIARSFGWALMGLGLGIGSGIATWSPKRIWHGAIGGFLGGFVGGFIFDLVGHSVNPVQAALAGGGVRDVGGPSRMIGFTAIGALTGFFIGLVEELMKQAWVKVLAGRNEGKDFILSKAVSLLGRDERCDVPLFGDMSIGVQHAAIRADGHRHVLIDGNTPTGTVVNGQRVPAGGELLLRDGDMIQIGSQRILFHEKATANKFARAPVDAPKAKSPVANTPMPSHLCPYCGSPKDAAGNCQCSLGAASPVGAGSVGSVPAGSYGAPAGANAGGYGQAASAPAYSSYGQTAPGGYGAPAGGVSEMPRLIGVDGPYAGQVFLLTGQNMIVGREPDKDLALGADTTISRTHARVVHEGGDFVLYDNNSSNGTFVNGLRISMQVLSPGDTVQFGSSKFRYE